MISQGSKNIQGMGLQQKVLTRQEIHLAQRLALAQCKSMVSCTECYRACPDGPPCRIAGVPVFIRFVTYVPSRTDPGPDDICFA